jgi:CHAT domain-containing protein
MGSLWGDFQKVARVLRDALEMQQEVFGEDHFLTAAASRELAAALGTMGKYTEAEALQRRALAIALRVLEEDHPLIGASYLNLAAALRRLGMYAEAAAMQRSALAFNLKSLGENHHETARSYNELAQSLQAHEQFSEAESTFRRVLAIRLKAMEERDKALEEGDLDKAFGDANRVIPPLFRHLYAVPPPSSVHGPRMNAEIARLRTAGMHAEAERLEAQGELDPTIAGCYHELAGVLAALGKHVEAEAKYRRALEIRLKLFGVNSPIGVQLSTAASYDGLGRFLQAHDNSAEAESLHRRALEIHRKVFGDDHPHTAISYRSLAGSLERQGRQAEALVVWDAAAASYDKARILGAKGLESALQRLPSPLPGFAVALAIAGKPREAWLQWEKGLARSVFDEVSRRATRPLTPREHEEEAKLLGQAHEIDERLGRLREVYMPAQQYEASRRELEQQANDVRRRLLELELQFETKYGAVVGQPAPIQSVQQALDVGTAVVGWIDEEPNHWACLLRHTGDPVWVRLLGSGQDGAWSEEDTSLATRLRAELDPDTSTGNAKPLAEALARQRLEPIKVHLKGIQRLVVVNSPGIAGVPLEVLMWSQPDPALARMTVCYAPSASMFVYLVARPSVRDRAPTLLAVGDPAYPESGRDNSAPPEPPDSGIAIVSVLPNGNAALHGLRGGDVLLTYAGKVPEKPEDLMFDAPETGPRRVPVRYWRDGITRAIDVAAGPLDVTLDYRPIGEVVLARRTASNILRGERRESNYRRLDGTRREVEAIAQLFPQYRVTTILGEKALESTVQNLARFGGLKAFRFLHFAAHGESDPHHAFRTALILLPDPERPGAFSQGADGRITAEQIVRTWELDADLVVLSACESALGLHVGSEGYLGFAQPLFAKGARSVVLSQWKVDDQATSLLMTRFYENLLGRRKGVNRPMPKARALHEARMWLRELTVDRVQQLTRSDPHKAQSARGPTPIRPFEHPSHWASFILIGDSN